VETKNAPAILVVDISPSIFVEVEPQLGRFKLLLHLIGALGLAANYFHDPVGVLAVSENIDFYLSPKLGQGQLFHALSLMVKKGEELKKAQQPKNTYRQDLLKGGVNAALEMLSGILRRQCSIVLLSDFTDAINGEREIDFKIIETLSSVHNWNVLAIFLDDPLEFDWQYRWGVVKVRNSETGQLIDIKVARAVAVRKRFCAEREGLRHKFAQAGVDSTVLSFGDHFNQLAQFLSERQSRLS